MSFHPSKFSSCFFLWNLEKLIKFKLQEYEALWQLLQCPELNYNLFQREDEKLFFSFHTTLSGISGLVGNIINRDLHFISKKWGCDEVMR